MIFNSILDTVGNTPVVRLNKLTAPGDATVLLKIESFNPMHSVKDRVALGMIEDAEERGELKSGMTVVEPTSGNTGIGLAMVCAAKGYHLLIVMPESMSEERKKLMMALGAELILTSAEGGMNSAVERAKEIVDSDPNTFMPQQFENPANPEVHEETTSKEILSDVPNLDAFVAGVGTGGTITGVGRALKRASPGTLVVAVEPARSPLLSQGKSGSHGIQGIGANFIPSILDMDVVDRVITVDDEDAIDCARKLAREEGIMVGISSGAALFASLEIARELGPKKTVLALLPDGGERYLSTPLWSDIPL
ncbi:MAG: cysteine synthase A [Methanomassiliicoccales archaeon]|nr:cysteine synthase A [Methanomassiliicoccales archaeon]NYT15347.1 cysteine synthase A [Methanomassiliicoccales archaeon]